MCNISPETCRQMSFEFSMIITTKNRAENLQRTMNVLRQLNPPPLEVLITADGCTDDTVEILKAETLKSEIKNLKLVVNEMGKGSVVSRDRMMREARGDIVLALDDDSYPEQSDCLARIISFFEQRPQLAVLHFPQRTDEYPETLTQTDFGTEHLTRSFANSGALLRRSVYLKLSGFEPRFFHMYEEPDYALQCVGAGYEVLFSPVISIRHHWSGQARSEMRNHHRHSRNEFWSVLLRCPFPYCLGLAVYRIFSQFRYACKRGPSWVLREPVWWWQALVGVKYCLHKRSSIPWQRYKIWLRLC
jgi:GT2 family glycosyltransferase